MGFITINNISYECDALYGVYDESQVFDLIKGGPYHSRLAFIKAIGGLGKNGKVFSKVLYHIYLFEPGLPEEMYVALKETIKSIEVEDKVKIIRATFVELKGSEF